MLTKIQVNGDTPIDIGFSKPYKPTRGKSIGVWTPLSNGEKTYFVAIDGSKYVKIRKYAGEEYSVEYLKVLYECGNASYSSINGVVKGEHDTIEEGGTLEDVLNSFLNEAKDIKKCPQIYFGELIKNDYTRKGKRHVKHDSIVWHAVYEGRKTTTLYLTREDTGIQARRLLKDCSLEQIRTLCRLLGNGHKGFNERMLPNNELEKSNAVELLGRVIGACWWLELKKKGNLSPNNKWIKVIKRARGL